MKFISALFLTCLLVGTFALPTLNVDEDMSQYFDHTYGGRIVGGTPAPEGSAPHSVALTQGDFFASFFCGGSIISPRHVLTAAHCIEAAMNLIFLRPSLRGRVGTNQWSTGGVEYSFSRNITHQNYVSSAIKNDIGILITTEEITFTDRIQPVALSFDYVDGGVLSKAAGWGRISAGSAISPVLLELYVSTIGGQECVDLVEQAKIDLNLPNASGVEAHIELCTFHSINHGMCNGDSGSALVREDNGQQIALVSWGFACARDIPDMFVRLSAFKDWVENGLTQL